MKKGFVLLFLLLLTGTSYAGNIGIADSGNATPIMYVHDVQCSTVVLFISDDALAGDPLQPSSWNLVDSVDMTPFWTNDSTIWNFGQSFNASGLFYVAFKVYEGNSEATSAIYYNAGTEYFKHSSAEVLRKLGPFGETSTSSGEFTVYEYLTEEGIKTDTVYKAVSATASLDPETEAQIDSILESVGWKDVYPSIHEKLGTFNDSTTQSLEFALSEYMFGLGIDIAEDLHSKVDGLGALSGDGGNAISIFVYDEGNSEYLQGANVRMLSSGGTNYYFPRTDVNGLATFALDDGTFYGTATVSGYTQNTVPDTITFTTDSTFTINLSTLSYSGSSAPDLCNLYFNTYDLLGDTLVKATVTVSPNNNGPWKAVEDSSFVLIPREAVYRTDSVGFVSISVWRTASLFNPRGDSIFYDIMISTPYHTNYPVDRIYVPDTNLWRAR